MGRADPTSLVVEFFGLPGVGKSALSLSLARELDQGGTVVTQPTRVLAHDIGRAPRRLRKSLLVAWEVLAHPLAAQRALRAIAASRQPGIATFVRVAFNWFLVVAVTRRAHAQGGIHLLDEGLLQAVWSIALEGGDEAAAFTLLSRHLPVALPDLIVNVEADLGLVEQRLRDRPDADSRLDRQPTRAQELLATGARLVETIETTMVATAPSSRLVNTPNETAADLDRGAKELAAHVRELSAYRAKSATSTNESRRVLQWLTWSSVGLGATGFGQFAVLIVLARYLTAAEFGVLTATLIVIALGKAFTNDVVGPALVQRADLQTVHVRAAAALSFLSALAMVIVLWLSAPAVAEFFHMPDIAGVMRGLSMLFVCQAPGLVPGALLQREMKIKELALSDLHGMLFGFMPLGIGLGVAGFGVWSLVAAYVGQAVVKSIVLVAARPHPIALLPDRRAALDLLHFSGGFVTGNLFSFAASQGDNFVIGRWLTATALGIYGRAYQLMWMPAMFLGEVMDRVLFPLMARAQADKSRLTTVYGRCVSLVVMIMAPVAIGGIVLSVEVVDAILGPGWDEVVMPFEILMAGLVFRTGYKISDSLSRATGTVYSRAWRQAIFALCICAGAFAGTSWGVTGVAFGIVAALGANYLMMAGLSIATTGLGWGQFGLLHVRGMVLGIVFGVLLFVPAALLRSQNVHPLLVLVVACGAAAIPILIAATVAPRAVIGADALRMLDELRNRRRS